MIEDDPFVPASKKPAPLEVQLELASIVDLEARIAALKAEIAACEAAIVKKQAQRNAADSVFTKR